MDNVVETDSAQQRAIERLLVNEAWRRGDLSYKFNNDVDQYAVYRQILDCPHPQFVLEASRKRGKTFILGVLACETAMKFPGERINFAAPTAKEASEILVPIMEEICADSPPDCKPVYTSSNGHFTWPNKSYVVLFGCDDEKKADRKKAASGEVAAC